MTTGTQVQDQNEPYQYEDLVPDEVRNGPLTERFGKFTDVMVVGWRP